MKRPSRVKVLGFNYKVLGMNAAQVMGYGAEGLHKCDELEICIADHLPQIRQVQVFLHEVLHAVCYSMGLRGESLDEETVVEKMSDGLIAVWRDNPYAFAWCNHHIQAEEEEWIQSQLEGEGDEDDELDEPEQPAPVIQPRKVQIRRR